MSTVLEELVTKISFRADPKGLETYNKKLEEAKKNASAMQRGLNDLRRSAIEAFAARNILFGIQSLLGFVVKTNAEFQTLRARLETVTGSQRAANREFARLTQFATKTPFELSNLVDSFAILKASGIEPTTEALTAFGNIAAANGKDITQFAEAANDAMTGEFERMKAFNIKISNEGDRLALQVAGQIHHVENNGKALTEFLTRLGNTDFAGGMEKQSKTLAGAWSNLQDAAAQAAMKIGEGGLNAALEQATREITETIEGSDELAETLGQFAGEVLTVLVQVLKDLLEQIRNIKPEQFRANLQTIRMTLAGVVELSSTLWKIFSGLVSVMGGPKGLVGLLVGMRLATVGASLAINSLSAGSAAAAVGMRSMAVAAGSIGAALAGAALIISQTQKAIAELKAESREFADDITKSLRDGRTKFEGAALRELYEKNEATIARLEAEDAQRRKHHAGGGTEQYVDADGKVRTRRVVGQSTLGAFAQDVGDAVFGTDSVNRNADAIASLRERNAEILRQLEQQDQGEIDRVNQREANRERGAAALQAKSELARARKALRTAKTKAEQKAARKRINELEKQLGREETDFSGKVKPEKPELSATQEAVKARIDALAEEAQKTAFMRTQGPQSEREAAGRAAAQAERARLQKLVSEGDIEALGGEFSTEAQMLRDIGIMGDNATPPVMTVSIVRVEAPVEANITIPVEGTAATPAQIGEKLKMAIEQVIESDLRRAIENVAPRQVR